MRDDTLPHNGQLASFDRACTDIVSIAASAETPLTTNPAGIKDEEESFRCMVLITFKNQHKPSR